MKKITLKAIVPAVLSCLMLTVAGSSAEAYMKYNGYHMGMGERQARHVAERVHPGRVVSEMRGHTANGDKAYRFHIENRSGVYSVGVDAVNGRVVENVKESRRVEGGNRIMRREDGDDNSIHRLFHPVHWM